MVIQEGMHQNTSLDQVILYCLLTHGAKTLQDELEQLEGESRLILIEVDACQIESLEKLKETPVIPLNYPWSSLQNTHNLWPAHLGSLDSAIKYGQDVVMVS